MNKINEVEHMNPVAQCVWAYHSSIDIKVHSLTSLVNFRGGMRVLEAFKPTFHCGKSAYVFLEIKVFRDVTLCRWVNTVELCYNVMKGVINECCCNLIV